MIERFPDRRRRWDVTVRDLPFALLLTGLSLIPALHGFGTRFGDLPTRPMDAPAYAVIALECLPLALRRKWPAASLALVAAAFAVDQIRAYHSLSGAALPIALFSTAAHLPRFRWTTVAVLSVAYVPLSFALAGRGSAESVTGFVTFYLTLALAWGVGSWLRRSRVVEAEHRRVVAETTRTAERTRIARELHDVVTHHVTAMVVQAEAARYLTAAPDRLDGALTAITDTGRQAVSDLRELLDLLNPAFGELRTLVERTRRAGQPVEFSEEGVPVAGDAEAVVYRVVQEGLTNALKHAYGRRTTVVVRHGVGEVLVEVGTEESGSPKLSVLPGRVENGGAPAAAGSAGSPLPAQTSERTTLPAAAAPGGSGRGLAGLRERVTLLGGELTARTENGTFLLRARIPAERPR